MQDSPQDTWADGDLYEPYVGRWSRPVAEQFVSWLAPKHGARWLDVNCATGVLTGVILKSADPATVIGVDGTEGYLESAKKLADDRLELHLAEPTALPLEDDTVDYVVSGLGLNFIHEPSAALAEMCRVASDGATIAAYVWDYAEGMQMIRRFWETAVALDPSASHLDEKKRFPLCQPDPLRRLFGDAGLADVEVRDIVVPTVFKDFDDYWTPLLGAQGPAPGYVMSMPEEDREHLREALKEKLAPGKEAKINLSARAWAVKGRRDR